MIKYRLLLIFFLLGLIVSGIHPHDYFTWMLEVTPAIAGFLVLLFTFRKFVFTDMTYLFILAHCYILFIGGHYTYAEVPLFNWIREALDQTRNNYDKLGHFAQGFVPALIVRELFIRMEVVKAKKWLPILVLSLCTAISALYELIEWGVSVTTGDGADAFLGTQGFIWDTQSDILFAMIGACSMLLLGSGIQDRQIDKHLKIHPIQ